MSCLRQQPVPVEHSYARRMSGQQTPATVALRRAGVAFTVHEYDHVAGTTRYGEEAVAALGVKAARVFKTLVVRVDARLAVGIVPVSATLDLKALAAAVGGKRAALAEPAEAARVTGYVVGGISPVAQRRRLPTALDRSAAGWDTVYVSAGRRGLQLDLAPADLLRVTGGVLADIAGR